jgi:hypothetical protein
MAQVHDLEAETVTYHGEVWTDGRGYATVELPAAEDALLPPFEYELRDLEPGTSARVTAELTHGRFAIATNEPHVKVEWRLTGQRSTGRSTSEPERSL